MVFEDWKNLIQKGEESLLGEQSNTDEEPVQSGHTDEEADNKAHREPIKWRHIFDWGFWTGHPLSTIAVFFIGGILLSAITNFPGGSPKQMWYVAGGLWLLSGVIIYWIFSGVIAYMEGRELLTAQEIEHRENEFKVGIKSRLDALEESQKPRRLTPEQKQKIREAILPYKGQKVVIWTLLFDSDGNRYAEDFSSVFKDAGWVCPQVKVTSFPLDFDNAVIAVNGTLTQETIPKGAGPLVRVLIALGITDNKGQDEFLARNDIGKDEICLQIGARKPPSSSGK